MQQAWTHKLVRDEQIPIELQNESCEVIQKTQGIEKILFPRWACEEGIIFSDASLKAYDGAAYLNCDDAIPRLLT